MAEKKPVTITSGKGPAKAKGEKSLAQTAIAFVVAGLIAGGVGVFHGMQSKPSAEAPKEAAKSPSDKTPFKLRSEDNSKIPPLIEMGSMDLPPVVTNLASPSDVWVRIEGTLLFEGKVLPHGEALASQISGDLLAFMRTQTLEQIQGVAGLQHLRQDLNERVMIRSEGRVKQFIIKALVVQ